MKVYVARQPIFDAEKRLYAYELLYRNSNKNAYDVTMDGSKATKLLLSDVTTVFRLKNLTNHKYAFINFTRDLLLMEIPAFFDSKDIVIEILEDVMIDDTFIGCVRELKKRGIKIAMDDYTESGPADRLFPYADIIKVDFRLVKPDNWRDLAKRLTKEAPKARLLAEKIETEAEFKQARKDGYALFQGYYFSKPIIFSKSCLEVANSTGMRLIKELNKKTPDYQVLAKAMHDDIGMTYAILKEMNAMSAYRGYKITNIKDALVRMGLSGVRKWVILKLMRSFSEKGSEESIRLALVRAVFAESIAEEIGWKVLKEKAFMAGMFSMIDTVMNEELLDILSEIALFDEVRQALLGTDNEIKRIIMTVTLFEEGKWEAAREVMGLIMNKVHISDLYVRAVNYADDVFCNMT